MTEYNLDLHTHLLKRRQSPKKYWQCVKTNDIQGTAITEYNYLKPQKAYFYLLAVKPKDKILIPGIKLMTDSGEVLVYASNEDVYSYSLLYEENVSLKRIYDFCEKKGYLMSIAHPFGLISNSASYIMGLSKLEKLIESKEIGVEAYTGQIGYLSYYMYDSFFLRKVRDLLDFFELNDFFKFVGLSSISEYFTHKLDQKSYDIVYKFSAAIKLGEKASYITAGSGSYTAESIGSGLLRLDIPKSVIDEPDRTKQNQEILDKIQHKKIIAVGPPGKYTENIFSRSSARKTKQKAYGDLIYLTKRSVFGSVKPKEK